MPIAPGSVRAILADYDRESRLVRFPTPSSGIVNHVLFVTTTREELVLKVFTDGAAARKPQKESAVFAHMRSIGIPTPRVCAVDTSRRAVPFSYLLTERSPGGPFSAVAASLCRAEVARIFASLGDYLGTLHSATFDRFGDIAGSEVGLCVAGVHEWEGNEPGVSTGPFGTWGDMHAQTVGARLRCMEGTGFANLVPAVQEYFEARQWLIDYAIVPRLLHMDVHPGNVVISQGEVSAILDVEEAVAGHNEYDLMRTELACFRGQDPLFSRAFMQAYTAHVALDEGYVLRKDFYDMSRTLVWIRSLILYGDKYAKGSAAHAHEAARNHLRSLLDKC